MNTLDMIMASQALFNLGKSLAELRDNLMYLKAHLPPYDELVGCQSFEGGISEVVLAAASTSGLSFHQNCMTQSLLPLLAELNQVLDLSN